MLMNDHRVNYLLSLLVLAFGLASCGFDPLCENKVKQEIISPDGSQKAVLFERNCGATTRYSYQISVLPRAAKLPSGPGNTFSSYVENPEVRWEGDRQLLIKYPKTSPFRAESSVADVAIRYQTDCQTELATMLAQPEVFSPDRQWRAVAFLGNCDEPVIDALQVAILPADGALPNHPNTVFVAETNELSMTWQGNQTLKIDYIRMGNVLVAKPKQGSINIRFNSYANEPKPLKEYYQQNQVLPIERR
uniref:Lipoprotein n=1 Tax=Cyanothece sp. (strain PCC 7425 / ATCC 29141) TaxID=395961 RepID=B8HJV7_CYAP4